MTETALTLKFRGMEADVLNKMVETGLFNTKSEAIRSALVHYSLELGLLGREKTWNQIQKFPKRKVSPAQLAKDLQELEDET
ncbi:hypothetical protein J4457_03285 [Candidatus Woesearchaeota archaeon]|nr:hypothetical protein [Candidatus Woesearchaeota archaeon]